jgi:hypothetical protein
MSGGDERRSRGQGSWPGVFRSSDAVYSRTIAQQSLRVNNFVKNNRSRNHLTERCGGIGGVGRMLRCQPTDEGPKAMGCQQVPTNEQESEGSERQSWSFRGVGLGCLEVQAVATQELPCAGEQFVP